jgi:hypothetical protein
MQLPCYFLTNMRCRGLQLWSKLFLAHPVFDRVKVGNISVIFSDYCRGTEQGICLSWFIVYKHICFSLSFLILNIEFLRSIKIIGDFLKPFVC